MTPGLNDLGVFVSDSLPGWASRALQQLSGIPALGAALVVIGGAVVLRAVHDPLATSKTFWRILSFFIGALTRRYAKAAVEKDTNEFLAKKLMGHVAGSQFPALEVKWVKEAQDARLHTDGTIIVRLRHERDQSRNALMAIATAAPHIFFPHARPYLHRTLVSGVDLEVLRLLAMLLGHQAQHFFSTEMLGPRTAADPELLPLLPILNDLAKQGLFGQVLLQEFIYLSDHLKHEPAGADLREEAGRFVSWLHEVAMRPPHDESGELDFRGRHIRVSFILAAKAVTAARGTSPYERALGVKLALGARSIYVLGLRGYHTKLCEQIAARFDADERVTRQRSATVVVQRDSANERLRIVHFRRNALFMPDSSFAEQVAAQGITAGVRCLALAGTVDAHQASLRIGALDARIRSSDVAWGYRGDVSRFVTSGQSISVSVISVDDERMMIQVGLKQLSVSPWTTGRVPRPGQRVRVSIEEHLDRAFVAKIVDPTHLAGNLGAVQGGPGTPPATDPSIFGRIPKSQWSWFDPTVDSYVQPTIGSVHQVEVFAVDESRDEILFSRRVLEVRDWNFAKRKYPNGSRARATVVQVTGEGLLMQLEPGIFGRIPEYKIREQGFEMEHFEQTVMRGNQYDVVVVGAKERRKDFRLDFARTPGAVGEPGGQ